MILKPRLFRKPSLSHPLARGLVGYWLMNEGAGIKVYDLSENGNDGVINGATWVPGKFGSALDFVTDDYVTTTGTNPQNYPNGTIIIWVNSDDISNGIRIWSGLDTGGTGEAFDLLFWDSTFNFYKTGGNDWDIISSIGISTGVWYQVACVWSDGNFARLYVNGVLAGEDLTADVGTHDDLNFGRRTDGASFFDGRLDHALYYSRVLTVQELTRHYLESFYMFERDPIELWSAATIGAPPVGMAGAMTTNTGYWGW